MIVVYYRKAESEIRQVAAETVTTGVVASVDALAMGIQSPFLYLYSATAFPSLTLRLSMVFPSESALLEPFVFDY